MAKPSMEIKIRTTEGSTLHSKGPCTDAQSLAVYLFSAYMDTPSKPSDGPAQTAFRSACAALIDAAAKLAE